MFKIHQPLCQFSFRKKKSRTILLYEKQLEAYPKSTKNRKNSFNTVSQKGDGVRGP